MNRRRQFIAVAAVVMVACVIGGLLLALDDDEDERLSSGQVVSTPAAPPRPVDPCPEPGPALIDTRTGRTLCGDEARRYIREEQRRRRRISGPSPSLLEQGRRIIRADPTLSAILRGHRYRIAQLGGWSAGNGRNELLGVGGFIDLAEPIEVDAVLPYVCAGDPAKGSGRLRVRVENVTRLQILAQFETNRVVQIGPLAKPGGPPPEGYPGERLLGSADCPPTRH